MKPPGVCELCPGEMGKEALEMPRADSGGSDRRMRREVPCVQVRARDGSLFRPNVG
jgi:hypothetical protein